ncbi:MAG: hypothetical protein WEA56_14595 [Balneolaceae bacterium]
MKMLKAVSVLLTGLLVMMVSEMQAQENFEEIKITYSLKYSESDYNNLQRTAERGITPEEFGRWLSGNGDVFFKTEGGKSPDTAELTILAVNESGNIIGESSEQVRVSERPSALNRVMNSGGIERALDRFFPGGSFFPSDIFFPGDTLFPSDTYITVVDGYRRAGVNAAQQALNRSSSDDGIIAVVLIVRPGKLDNNMQASLGGAVFVGSPGR